MMQGLAGESDSLKNRTNVQIIVVCITLAAGIFAIDVSSLPLGVAAGVAYVAVVLVSLWLPKWQHSLAVAGGVSILTILGYLLSEPAGVPWMVVTNRMLALVAIWLTAVVGGWLVFVKRRKLEEALQNAERETDRANKAKSRFLETTSNDMRQHLQTLSLLSAVLRKSVTDPKLQKMCAQQGEAVAQLGDLLNSILEFSELESGDVELKIAETSVKEIFQRLQDEFQGQAQTKGLHLRFESKDEVACSDRMLLSRIIRSLLSNAIRYTNQGTVDVSCRREHGDLIITVRDTGIGISPDNLASIFDEFYRIDHDPVARNAGRGLGLAVVQSSANLLGANVGVKSEPGKGSSFSITVPAAR